MCSCQNWPQVRKHNRATSRGPNNRHVTAKKDVGPQPADHDTTAQGRAAAATKSSGRDIFQRKMQRTRQPITKAELQVRPTVPTEPPCKAQLCPPGWALGHRKVLSTPGDHLPPSPLLPREDSSCPHGNLAGDPSLYKDGTGRDQMTHPDTAVQ